MASLWKQNNSPFFTCCYDSADGRRLKKTTKQTDRTKAMEVCLAIERTEKVAKDGAMTEAVAKKIIGEILERTTGTRLHHHRADKWLDEWVEAKKQTKQASTTEVYGRIVREFKASLGERAHSALAAVAASDVVKYRASILAVGKSPKTANHSITCLGVAFNKAFRLGIIPANPCAAVESLEEETRERATFTTKQVAKLMASAEEDWRRAIVFGFYTGARLGDVAAMKWSMIDLTARTIAFRPKKTKKAIRQITIPIHPELEAELMKAPGVGAAPVFPSLHGLRTSELSRKFGAIMVRARVQDALGPRENGGKGKRHNSLSFHSLRHSFTSAMANAGVSPEIRMKLTGHTNADTHAIYTHHEDASLRAAIGLIPRLSALSA